MEIVQKYITDIKKTAYKKNFLVQRHKWRCNDDDADKWKQRWENSFKRSEKLVLGDWLKSMKVDAASAMALLRLNVSRDENFI